MFLRLSLILSKSTKLEVNFAAVIIEKIEDIPFQVFHPSYLQSIFLSLLMTLTISYLSSSFHGFRMTVAPLSMMKMGSLFCIQMEQDISPKTWQLDVKEVSLQQSIPQMFVLR